MTLECGKLFKDFPSHTWLLKNISFIQKLGTIGDFSSLPFSFDLRDLIPLQKFLPTEKNSSVYKIVLFITKFKMHSSIVRNLNIQSPIL